MLKAVRIIVPLRHATATVVIVGSSFVPPPAAPLYPRIEFDELS